MNLRFFRSACLVLIPGLFLALSSAALQAQESATPPADRVTVGVFVDPPFVIQQDGGFTGMAVDLWEALASSLAYETDYVVAETVRDLVDAAVAGDIDVAVTNLTITRNRAERIDFTHPWFDAGLRIMVEENGGEGFEDLLAGLSESGHLRAYGWIAFIVLIATILVTLFDRRFDKDFPVRWRDGLAESFYTVMSVTTSGRPPSRKNLFGWVGRIWQGIWLLCGIAVFAYLTSSVASVMTTLALTNQINSVADLPGHPVGVITGSVAEEYAREARLDVHSFVRTEEAVKALRDGKIDAIIGDAPVLEYYAHSNADQHVMVVGGIFEPDKYGFGVTRGSALLRPLTLELIEANERGVTEEIKASYFGDEP